MNWDKLLGGLIWLSLLPLLLTIGAVVCLGVAALCLLGALLTAHERLIDHWYHRLAADELPGQPPWWEV